MMAALFQPSADVYGGSGVVTKIIQRKNNGSGEGSLARLLLFITETSNTGRKPIKGEVDAEPNDALDGFRKGWCALAL